MAADPTRPAPGTTIAKLVGVLLVTGIMVVQSATPGALGEVGLVNPLQLHDLAPGEPAVTAEILAAPGQVAPLFTELSFEDTTAIVKDLERQGIPYELKNDSTTILVPKDKVTRLRMKLAEGGLPKGGGVGYEIFDKSDALGTTSFVQNINHLRALEGELARTIRALSRVESARVHLVLPERPLFSRDKSGTGGTLPRSPAAFSRRRQAGRQTCKRIRPTATSRSNPARRGVHFRRRATQRSSMKARRAGACRTRRWLPVTASCAGPSAD